MQATSTTTTCDRQGFGRGYGVSQSCVLADTTFLPGAKNRGESRTYKTKQKHLKPHSIQFRYRDERLELLGYPSYDDYLRSDEWRAVRQWVRSRRGIRWRRCRICHTRERLEIHHLTYSILGKGTTHLGPRSLSIVCRDCHEHIHELTKLHGWSLRVATEKLSRMHNRLRSEQESVSRKVTQERLAAVMYSDRT